MRLMSRLQYRHKLDVFKSYRFKLKPLQVGKKIPSRKTKNEFCTKSLKHICKSNCKDVILISAKPYNLAPFEITLSAPYVISAARGLSIRAVRTKDVV